MMIFRIPSVCIALAILSFPGTALAQDQSQATTVTLSNFAFTPKVVTLRANTPYRLHLVNAASGDHAFSAPEFFAAATITPSDQSKISNGAVEIEGGQSIDVTVTPTRAGTYALKCTHFMHAVFGMTGQIVVQ